MLMEHRPKSIQIQKIHKQRYKSFISIPFGGPIHTRQSVLHGRPAAAPSCLDFRPPRLSCFFFQAHVEVRDSPHGIFASCTQYPRGLTRWAELLGCRRRRRRQLVLPGCYRPPDSAPCCPGAEAFQAHGPNGPEVRRFQFFSISRFRGHTRMLGPSVFPDSRVIPEWLVL